MDPPEAASELGAEFPAAPGDAAAAVTPATTASGESEDVEATVAVSLGTTVSVGAGVSVWAAVGATVGTAACAAVGFGVAFGATDATFTNVLKPKSAAAPG
jgi:hypothetical protein